MESVVYRGKLEARSNYITALGDLTGNNWIEKDRVRVPPGSAQGKWENEQCDLLCVEGF